MTIRRLFLLLLVILAVVTLAARARSRHAPDDRASAASSSTAVRYTVTGIVTAAPIDGRVMVAHDEIPDYMPAMTMPFAVDRDAPPRVRAGDRVQFTLIVDGTSTLADQFHVTGHDARVTEALAAPRRSRVRVGDAWPEVALTRETGAAFTTADLRGHRTAITFIFTRCPVPEFCPLMVKRFQQIQRQLDADTSLADVRLLAITLDPTFDSPEILRAYATAMQADPDRWAFATGEPVAITALTRALAIHVERNGVLLDHTLATALVDADGRIAGLWRGNGWTAEEVLTTIRTTR